jgi:hypothetical protein
VGGWIAAQFEEGNRSDSSGERDRSNHFAEGIVGVLVSRRAFTAARRVDRAALSRPPFESVCKVAWRKSRAETGVMSTMKNPSSREEIGCATHHHL